MKKALVCGASGFIGRHLVKRLKKEGYWVRGVDIQKGLFPHNDIDEFLLLDLRDRKNCVDALTLDSKDIFDEVYQLAADMGGAGFIFIGDNDFDIMHNSGLINLNIAGLFSMYKKIFFSSSACVYPAHIQEDVEHVELKEDRVYPAYPDSEYGWEKIFTERLLLSLYANKKREVRIARFHNIYGPEGVWTGGREKVPAAMCRKIAELPPEGGEIEVWGDGNQIRSFLFVDECIEGVRRLMDSDCREPLNIGSSEKINLKDLAYSIAEIANKKITLRHIDGPIGVKSRNSDNNLIKEKLNWTPEYPLKKGISETYFWIENEIRNQTSN